MSWFKDILQTGVTAFSQHKALQYDYRLQQRQIEANARVQTANSQFMKSALMVGAAGFAIYMVTRKAKA